jgi:serine/threonine protein kinase
LTEFLEDFATLDEVIREGKLSDEQKADIARKLVAGLAVIHSRGVAHRDIKPQNVMVTKSGPTAVKYIDFGLSCLRQGCNTRVVGGTPGYMPSELYMLLRNPVRLWNLDALQRTDLWSLGLTIWQLVQGKMTLKAWQAATEQWYAANKPQMLRTLNQLPAAERSRRWQRMFVNNFNYNSPTDQLAAQNTIVEQFLAKNAAPSIRSMLNRNPNARTLPSTRTAGATFFLPHHF